jgi:hypothetical protein
VSLRVLLTLAHAGLAVLELERDLVEAKKPAVVIPARTMNQYANAGSTAPAA